MSAAEQLIPFTVDIVSSHLANNTVAVGDVPSLIHQVHGALSALGSPALVAPERRVAIVSLEASVKPSYVVCMECGKKQKALKSHLHSAHGMTPEQYREGYGLPHDHPIVAPDYSAQRSRLAKEMGLGRKK